jgi:hypothetical protein
MGAGRPQETQRSEKKGKTRMYSRLSKPLNKGFGGTIKDPVP